MCDSKSQKEKTEAKYEIELTYDKFKDRSMLRLAPLKVGDDVFISVASFASGPNLPLTTTGG